MLINYAKQTEDILFNTILTLIDEGLYWMILIETIRKVYGLIAHCIAPTSVSLKSSLKIYISQLDNWLEWSCLICLTTLAIVVGSEKNWHIYVGTLAVLIGWSNLMILIGQLPFFGAYVAMYTCVLKEMGKLLIVYSSMLIGFAVSFYVIFGQQNQFQSFSRTLIKVLVMMTGELEFNDLFRGSEKNSTTSIEKLQEANIEIVTLVIFTTFLLLVSVVLMNLLVAIAVHDIHGLRTSAAITKLRNQVNLIGCIETALPDFCSLGIIICCCLCRKKENRLKNTEGMKRRSKDMGTLSVQPHSLKIDSLPRDIVSIAYEVANRMNPYQGSQQSMKDKSRKKGIYGRQRSSSVYETIIPRNDCNKRKKVMNRKSKYINLDNIASNHTLLSIRFENGLRSISDEVKDIKDAYTQQATDSAELKRVLEQQNLMLTLLLEPKYST
jgi:Ion transport protein